MNKIQDAKVENKRILLRVDYNIPLKDGEILSDARIKKTLPTIEYLIENGAAAITIITHLGKPKGKFDPKYSLWPVANRLAELLHSNTKFNTPRKYYDISNNLIMLDNLRFNPGEEQNDINLAKQLAANQDIFVSDAFGTLHRAHASTVAVTKFLPSYAGLLVQKEVENLAQILDPARTFVCVLGGAKTAEKIKVIENLSKKTDYFLLGGVMANTFLKAKGIDIKESIVADGVLEKTKELMANLAEKIILPEDLIYGDLEGKSAVLDIGKYDVEKFKGFIKKAATIFWNGNLGMTEKQAFRNGSQRIAEAIVLSKAKKYAGGGDTVGFIEELKLEDKFDFVSTGGGATLEFLAGKNLPGLRALG